MEWIIYTSTWYVMLLIIGLIFFPTARVLFPIFYDKGYAFSKAMGVMFISYITFVLGTAHILPFTLPTLLIVILGSIVVNYLISAWPKRTDDTPVGMIIFEELLFAMAFFTWAYIRSKEPSIHGLEKFMDFGFINSVLRGRYFPSQDMWLAGKAINYYYFGHITGAVLTKLSSIPSYISYNLILAHLCGLGVIEAFSIGFTCTYRSLKKNVKIALSVSLLSTFLVNIGGNLHSLYTLTTGYGQNPTELWKLPAKFSFADLLHPLKIWNNLPQYYWYPDATRFIPFTIHEFPIYSYVVADLHGHVFDIPFVLITIALLYTLFTRPRKTTSPLYRFTSLLSNIFTSSPLHLFKTSSPLRNFTSSLKNDLSFATGNLGYVILLSLMMSIHLMTNAFDAPIYLLLTLIILAALYGISQRFFIYSGVLIAGFFIFTYPFSRGFEPFSSGVGFNCFPSTLSAWLYQHINGTFLEKRLIFEGNCQTSTWWMLATLWGFFWFNGIFLIVYTLKKKFRVDSTTLFMLLLFGFSTILIIVPEFIYAKDIYPSHFRANTMFKLGYQAFIMMGLASAFTFGRYKKHFPSIGSAFYIVPFLLLFFFVALYPLLAIDSFYGFKDKPITLRGEKWIAATYPEYDQIITYFNSSVKGQPTILEAQGDSYTDLNVVSSYTGLPTVAGWWVHQWLWRGGSDVVGKIIPDIQLMYTSPDLQLTRDLLKKYNVAYVVIGSNERKKYTTLDQSKFEALGRAVFKTSDESGIIYQIPLDSY